MRKKKPTSKFKNKRDYLTRVNANDCIKDKITGIYTVTTKNIEKQEKTQRNKKKHNKTKHCNQRPKQRKNEQKKINKQTGPQIGKIAKTKTKTN